MIKLFQGPRAWGGPNLSPFCAKLETYLRMTDVKYELKTPDMRKAPKGKVPYIELEGRLIGDSTLIIEVLKQKLGDPLDARLSASERAQGWLMQRTFEEGSYFTEVHNRWATENFPEVRNLLFGSLGMPKPLALVVGTAVRRGVRRTLQGQGIARHEQYEIYDLARRDFMAAATLLGDKPYLFGSEPTSFDAVLYAFTIGAFRTPFAAPYGECPVNLSAHADRIHTRYFADLGKSSG
jgi:glutathione S-transferase